MPSNEEMYRWSIEANDRRKQIKQTLKGDPDWGDDLPWSMFMPILRNTSSQMYGRRLQRRFTINLGYSSSEKIGDAVDEKGELVEMKTSVLNEHKSEVCVRQIRTFHSDIKTYWVFIIDKDDKIYPFRFDIEGITKAIKLYGDSCTHGSKNDGNINHEKNEGFEWL